MVQQFAKKWTINYLEKQAEAEGSTIFTHNSAVDRCWKPVRVWSGHFQAPNHFISSADGWRTTGGQEQNVVFLSTSGQLKSLELNLPAEMEPPSSPQSRVAWIPGLVWRATASAKTQEQTRGEGAASQERIHLWPEREIVIQSSFWFVCLF